MTWIIIALSWFLVLSNGEEPLAAPSVKDHGLPVRGFPFSLSCIAVVLPFHVRVDQLTFTWFKDDLELEGQSAVTLSFDRVTRSNEGSYTCRVSLGSTLSTSAQSRPFSLDVMVHPNVTIEPTTPNSEIKAVLGSSVTLTCVVREAYPRVLDNGYSWSYRLLVTDEWKSLSQGEKSLTLTNVTREARGHYKCQARNDAGVEGQIPPGEASVSVEVLYLENFALTRYLRVNEGDHVTLTCSVDSNPPALLTWLVDGEEVRHVTYNVDNYVLERAACSDSKTYTCRASNSALPGLERNASTHVLVTCTEDVSANVSTTTTTSTEPEYVTIAASFRVRLSDVIELSISHPTGQVMIIWQQPCRSDVTPEFSHRVTCVSCDATSRRLAFSLNDVTSTDEGEYVCHGLMQGRKPFRDSFRLALKGHDGADGVAGDYPANSWALVLGTALVVVVTLAALFIVMILRRAKREVTWSQQNTPLALPMERTVMMEGDV